MPTILVVTRLETSRPGVDVEDEAQRVQRVIREAVTDHKVFDEIEVSRPMVLPDEPLNQQTDARRRAVEAAFGAVNTAVGYARLMVAGAVGLVEQEDASGSVEEEVEEGAACGQAGRVADQGG